MLKIISESFCRGHHQGCLNNHIFSNSGYVLHADHISYKATIVICGLLRQAAFSDKKNDINLFDFISVDSQLDLL